MSLKLSFPIIPWHQRPVFHMRLVFLSVSLEYFQLNPKGWVLKVNGNLASSSYILGNVPSVRFGRRVGRRQHNPLLFHPVGLGTHDQTEKILIGHGRSLCWRNWSSTPLVIQSGSLEWRRLHQIITWLFTVQRVIVMNAVWTKILGHVTVTAWTSSSQWMDILQWT